MIRNFEDKVILTSQYPDAFLTFDFDGGDTRYIKMNSINIEDKILYINGLDASNNVNQLTLSNIDNRASFHINTNTSDVFEYAATIDIISDDTITVLETIDISILNRPYIVGSDEFNVFKTGKTLVDEESSYLLLRSNPKYTGNIKLMVDSSDNLYLDTFKISEILSNKKYRKQSVSGNSFLSGDIRKVFGSLPIGEIYKVDDEDTLDISNPKTEFDEQYNNTYNYGARGLADELYSDNYSILAPLWINSKIPDYFAIFRLDGVINEETYEEDPEPFDLATNFIKNGNLIKSWDLKNNAPVGKYLDNHLQELNKIISPVNLSLNEYDPNTWYGIAVDKGIITGRSEVPYFFEKTTHNFTDTNAFISQGFERNNLLCPNLINLEYTFNDDAAELYSMHRYFGLYLTENELYKVAYYKDTSTSDVNILSLNEPINGSMLSAIFDNSTGDILETYKNRVLVLNDNENLYRISNENEISGTAENIQPYINKLGENLFSTPIDKVDINTFISFKINNLLKPGEHLRVINNNQSIIWEVYGVNSDLYEKGQASQYASKYINYPTVYRVAFSTKGDIADQIIAIQNAFNVFSQYNDVHFRTGIRKTDSLSILIKSDYDNGDVFTFQRIMSNTLIDLSDPGSEFNNSGSYDDISFYGIITPSIDDFTRVSIDYEYGPINFELYGDRLSLEINMLNPIGYHTYSFDFEKTNLFSENVFYHGTDDWNRLVQNFNINTEQTYKSLYVEDPIELNNNGIILTENEIITNDDKLWDAYDVFPLSISLMGINDVKDMDFVVYDSSTVGMDSKSEYWYKRDNDASTGERLIKASDYKWITQKNGFVILDGRGVISFANNETVYDASIGNPFYFNTFFNPAKLNAETDTRISYNEIVGDDVYTSYEEGKTEENIDDYYTDEFKTKLKYGLTVPTISKWGGNGSDIRNNPIRLNLTGELFDENNDINSNFIPYINPIDSGLYTYKNEVSYPVFKYLDPGERNWEDYVYYDFGDVVFKNGQYSSIKDLMISYPQIDIFSKLVYSNKDISGKNSRSSIMYYNKYNDDINTISKGLNVSISVGARGQSALAVQNWDKYRFSLISTASQNKTSNNPIEVIINENTATILVIWYQGADTLNYAKRQVDIVPGKGILVDDMGLGDKNYYNFKTNDPAYTYTKAPYIVNTANISQLISNMYSVGSNYGVSESSPYAQYNKSTIGLQNSGFYAYMDDNEVINSVFKFNKSYDSFNHNHISYDYVYNVETFGSSVINNSFIYNNNVNNFKDYTCSLDMLKYIFSLGNIYCQIIQDDKILNNMNFGGSPLTLRINEPIKYSAPNSESDIYTYNGNYGPIFKNILNFTSNEDSTLINEVETDFIFANTNLRSSNNIEQYWFNKVVEEIPEINKGNNILFTTSRNPFDSLWDNNYYTLSDGDNTTLVPGSVSKSENPSFFGSKLIALPDTLILENWNKSNAKLSTGTDYYLIEYNLSDAIVEIFNSNPSFLINWSGLTEMSVDLINEYIIKMTTDYYNISISKIEVDMYSKPYNESILFLNDIGFDNKLANIEADLFYENDKYIYKIKIPKSMNKSYFTKFTFNKK